MKKIKILLALSWFDKLNYLSNYYWKFKTQFYYQPFFNKIGRGSVIRNPLLLSNTNYISIGKQVFIRDGARIEVIKNSQKKPLLQIGDNTNIEQSAHIICHSKILIGKNCSITGFCCIVDVNHPYDDIDDTRKIGLRIDNSDSFIEIGDNCFLGFRTTIMPNVKLGNNCVVGANTLITKSFPAYSVIAGNPAKMIKRYDLDKKMWKKVDSNENFIE
ncbi:acyltransferase [Sulfuricurvum sp.]|uniref:acyltransferase n=1 Tax=Sulfuricurvum sp. TaxID=2025608 RepID=UPI0026214B8D|nr:acyltransferase [Sulfuricurvum sp.]MDD4950727.1 acyltransferase [Sulfuricurvum sp.]